MSMELPRPVAAYLHAKDDTDVDDIIGAFAAEAVVHDEGKDHVGRDAIRAWADEVSSAYQLTRTILGARTIGAATVVGVRVAGNFPGSPVDLHHHFTVAGERITALTICP